MLYSIEELKELSKPYFENNDIEAILCTNDGNFFYLEGKKDAENHAKSSDLLKLETINRLEVFEPNKEEVKEEEEIEAPKKKAAKPAKVKNEDKK
jgi:hypothetical protein